VKSLANTPKLGLYLPVNTDVDHAEFSLGHQYTQIDQKFDCYFGSQFNRPPVPFLGQLCWQADTKDLMEWDGANWVVFLSPKAAFGKMVYDSISGPSNVVGKNQEDGPFLKGTFTQIAGRKYRVTYSVGIDTTSAQTEFGDNQIRIRSSNTGSVGTGDTLVFWNWCDYANNNDKLPTSHCGTFEFTASDNKSLTLGLFLQRANVSDGNILLHASQKHTFAVEDVGK
jgi:hypothetical protein